MHGAEKTGVGNSFRRIHSVHSVERQYRNEINGLLRELNALLPRYRMCVNGAQYASERNKLAVLTACYNDTSLDEQGLETLLQSLVDQRLALTDAIKKRGRRASNQRKLGTVWPE
jgi:hypothetical protein